MYVCWHCSKQVWADAVSLRLVRLRVSNKAKNQRRTPRDCRGRIKSVLCEVFCMSFSFLKPALVKQTSLRFSNGQKSFAGGQRGETFFYFFVDGERALEESSAMWVTNKRLDDPAFQHHFRSWQ